MKIFTCLEVDEAKAHTLDRDVRLRLDVLKSNAKAPPAKGRKHAKAARR